VHSQANLLKIVRALSPPRCFAGRLHSRQEQRNQHRDNRDHYQQLDQSEASAQLTHR
jgi:hypothetical protein